MAEPMDDSDPAWPALEAEMRREMAGYEAERSRLVSEIAAIERAHGVMRNHPGKSNAELVAAGLLSPEDAREWETMVDELRASGAYDRIKAEVRARRLAEIDEEPEDPVE